MTAFLASGILSPLRLLLCLDSDCQGSKNLHPEVPVGNWGGSEAPFHIELFGATFIQYFRKSAIPVP